MAVSEIEKKRRQITKEHNKKLEALKKAPRTLDLANQIRAEFLAFVSPFETEEKNNRVGNVIIRDVDMAPCVFCHLSSHESRKKEGFIFLEHALNSFPVRPRSEGEDYSDNFNMVDTRTGVGITIYLEGGSCRLVKKMVEIIQSECD